MRSRKVSPGRAVMRTTIWSDSTRVPPVTAERSPPDSRMTGADSPVMADSSTEAMPSMISPSDGIISPADTTTTSSMVSCDDGTCSMPAVGAAAVGHRLGAGLAQGGGLRLAAALGHRLGEVGEQHGEPQPGGDEPGEEVLLAGGVAEVAEEQDRGEHAADQHHEHDRVAGLHAGVELAEAVDDAPAGRSPARTAAAWCRGRARSGAGGGGGLGLHRVAPRARAARRWGRAPAPGRR